MPIVYYTKNQSASLNYSVPQKNKRRKSQSWLHLRESCQQPACRTVKLFALLWPTYALRGPAHGYSAAQLAPKPVRHDRSHPTNTITSTTNTGDAQHVRRELTTLDLSAASRQLRFRTQTLLYNNSFYPMQKSTQSQSQTSRDNTAVSVLLVQSLSSTKKGKETSLILPLFAPTCVHRDLVAFIRDLVLKADGLDLRLFHRAPRRCVPSTAYRHTGQKKTMGS